MKSIVLIGYRASGKTAVGEKLARKLGLPFYDSDRLLVHRLGRSIREFVAEQGWDAFRAREKAVLKEIFSREPGVVSLGGGAVLDPENRRLIREKGRTVWLKAEVPTLLKRMRSDTRTADNRPPLSALNWEQEAREVLARRKPIYEETADTILDTEGKSIEEVVEALLGLFPEAKP